MTMLLLRKKLKIKNQIKTKLKQRESNTCYEYIQIF